MSQAEGLDVVWRPEMVHSDLLITVSCDDVLVIQRHCLKDGTRASLADILIKNTLMTTQRQISVQYVVRQLPLKARATCYK